VTGPSRDFAVLSLYVYLVLFFLWERVLTRSTWGSKSRGDRDPLTPLFFVLPAVGMFFWMALMNRWLPPHPTWISYGAGVLAGALGFTIRSISKRTLGRFFTVRVQLQEDHRIVDQGIYARVRHPLYTGFILEWIAPPLLMGSPIGFLFITIPLALVILARIPREEALLVEAFGESYRAYMRRTKRLVPGLW
jgi:protein-S-isoprenylcysteine O-methyltransferase Ste14